jgi:hypothetical protein
VITKQREILEHLREGPPEKLRMLIHFYEDWRNKLGEKLKNSKLYKAGWHEIKELKYLSEVFSKLKSSQKK